LGLVPAFFPVQFDETELAVAWGLVGFCEAYLRIFGNPDKSNTSTDSSAVRKNPLIHRIDTVLTSISIEGRPFGFGKAASLIAPQLSEVLVGDIGGVPLKKPNLPSARLYRTAPVIMLEAPSGASATTAPAPNRPSRSD